MFKIKICGITSPEDALLAAEAGADAIGLNFYEQSPRYVTPERAGQISSLLRSRCEKHAVNAPLIVGVFVHSPGLIAVEPHLGDPLTLTMHHLGETQVAAGFDAFQLHGEEPPELIANLNITNIPERRTWLSKLMLPDVPDPPIPVIRAFRCRKGGLTEVNAYLRECLAFGNDVKALEEKSKSHPEVRYIDWSAFPSAMLPYAVLLDAYAPGAYGGTGQVVDWNVVRNERDLLMGLPVILAGGLTPENVAEAIITARPDAVDVASGVESAPGKKDPEKVRRFIAEARRAFEELQGGRL